MGNLCVNDLCACVCVRGGCKQIVCEGGVCEEIVCERVVRETVACEQKCMCV